MLTSNLSLVRKEVTKIGVGIDVASRKARDEMAMALQQLARNEIRRSGAPQAGGPPVNRTGNLRNSINTEKRNIGFANYKAIIGPQAVYGRILELGFSNGNKYPYMLPAYRKFQSVAPSIIKKHLSGRGL
jgi:phage gpG-like protein